MEIPGEFWQRGVRAGRGSLLLRLQLAPPLSPCVLVTPCLPALSRIGLGLLRGQLASEECRGASGGLSVEQTSSQVLQLL